MVARSDCKLAGKTSDDVISTPLFTDAAEKAYCVKEEFNDIYHSELEADSGAKNEEKSEFEQQMAEVERALLEDGDNNEDVGATNGKPSGQFKKSDQFDRVRLDEYLANDWGTLSGVTEISETSPLPTGYMYAIPTGEKNDDMLSEKYVSEQLTAEAEQAVPDDRDNISWDVGAMNEEPASQFDDSERNFWDKLEVKFPGIYNYCYVDYNWDNLPDLTDNSETYPVSVGDNINISAPTRYIPDSPATTSIGDNYTFAPTKGFVDNLALSDPLLSSNDVLLPHDNTQSSQALEIQNVLEECNIEQGGSVQQQSQREHRDDIFLVANQSGAATEQHINKGRWTKEEHGLFIEGLEKHGKGKWTKIASIVGTRTRLQVASHAQKYFDAMKISEPNVISSKICNRHPKDFPEDDVTLSQEFKRRRVCEDETSRSVKTGYKPDNNGSVLSNHPQLVHISAPQNSDGVPREQHFPLGANHYAQLHQPQGHQTAAPDLPHHASMAPLNRLSHQQPAVSFDPLGNQQPVAPFYLRPFQQPLAPFNLSPHQQPLASFYPPPHQHRAFDPPP